MRIPQKILLALVALILYLCLFPWTVKQGAPGPWFVLYWPSGRTSYVDFLLNTLLFLPLGLFAAFAFPGRGRLFRALATGAGVSLTVEILQGWLPARVSSFSDLLANSLGTVLGIGLSLVITRSKVHPLPWFRDVRVETGPLLLLCCFLVGQCFPFIPNYRLPHLQQALEALSKVPPDSIAAAVALTLYATVALLLKIVVSPELAWRARLLLPLSFLLVRPLFAAVPMSGLELAGALGGLAIGAMVSRDRLWRGLFVLLPVVLVLVQLQPIAGATEVQDFRWMPFAALFELSSTHVIRLLAEKLFRYGALIAVLSRWPSSLPLAGILVTTILGVTEGIQVYVPGRTPESTDPVLSLIAWALLAASSWEPAARVTRVPSDSPSTPIQ